MKKSIQLINITTNIIQHVLLIVSGIIIPKIILSYFGSEVNGLISSINQFLSYITLVEGGVSSVIMASLYKPLVDHDEYKISMIIKTSNVFYRKIALIYLLYSVCFGLIYPLLVKSSFNYFYIFALIIILSFGLLIQYTMSLSLRNLLIADNKTYVVACTQIIVSVMNVVLAYLSIFIYPSIHLLKLLTAVSFLVWPIVFHIYVKKKYTLTKNVDVDNSLLKSRWNGFAINIAAFIHFSTDIVILTIFTNLTLVSVYSVYSLVTSGLRGVVIAVSNAVSPMVGKAYAKGDENKLIKMLETHETIINFAVFTLFTVSLLLITPFVNIYTNGINDANYNQPLFGIILILSEVIYLLKLPHTSLAYSANKFKELTIPCFIEAFINIVVSVICVLFIGLIGVAIGTLSAMLFRMIHELSFTKKIIPKYSAFNYLTRLVPAFLGSLVCLIFGLYVLPQCNGSLLNWIWHGFLYIFIEILFVLVFVLLLDKKALKQTYNFLMRNKI